VALCMPLVTLIIVNLACEVIFITCMFHSCLVFASVSSYMWPGFDCRCGGHFCSMHRYSDIHQCPFNYQALSQLEIRKHNPVVAAEKVKKI